MTNQELLTEITRIIRKDLSDSSLNMDDESSRGLCTIQLQAMSTLDKTNLLFPHCQIILDGGGSLGDCLEFLQCLKDSFNCHLGGEQE